MPASEVNRWAALRAATYSPPPHAPRTQEQTASVPYCVAEGYVDATAPISSGGSAGRVEADLKVRLYDFYDLNARVGGYGP